MPLQVQTRHLSTKCLALGQVSYSKLSAFAFLNIKPYKIRISDILLYYNARVYHANTSTNQFIT